MGKLYDTLNNIEDGRKLCVQYLNEQNITTSKDANIHQIASNIQLGVNGIDLWDINTPLTNSNKELKRFITALPLLNTSQITNMSYFFDNCSSLRTISLIDTSNTDNMYGMFNNCKALITIPQLDTSKVTEMQEMFQYCESLTSIPALDTSKVISMNSMFSFCSSLKTVSSIDTSKVISMAFMFYNCISLQEINLNKAPILPNCEMPSNVFVRVPSDCLIRVYDEASKQKVLASRSDLTNVVVEPYSGGNQ